MKFKDFLKENNPELLEEILKENFLKNAAMAGVLGTSLLTSPSSAMNINPQVPAVVKQIKPEEQIKNLFDLYTQNKPTMTPQEWQKLAIKYPGNKNGLIPNPNQPGNWIPKTQLSRLPPVNN